MDKEWANEDQYQDWLASKLAQNFQLVMTKDLEKQIFQVVDSKTKWAIMLESTYKQLRRIAMKKRGGKKC